MEPASSSEGKPCLRLPPTHCISGGLFSLSPCLEPLGAGAGSQLQLHPAPGRSLVQGVDQDAVACLQKLEACPASQPGAGTAPYTWLPRP